MAFKFVAVLCLATFVAAGDYEYNKPNNNSFDIGSNDNHQQNVAPAANNSVVQNTDASQSYSNGNGNNTQGDNDNDNTSYDEGSYSASGDYQSVNIPPVAPAAQRNNLDINNAPSDYYESAKYEYAYGVNDPTTGDIKSHYESRDGNYARGVYSLVDPDGYKRTVTYTVDGASGYNAVVHREPIAIKLVAPVVNFKSPAIVVAGDSTLPSAVKSSQEVTSNVATEVRDSYASPPAQEGKGPYA